MKSIDQIIIYILQRENEGDFTVEQPAGVWLSPFNHGVSIQTRHSESHLLFTRQELTSLSTAAALWLTAHVLPGAMCAAQTFIS